MKQVFQDLKTGETRLAEVPRPSAGAGQVLIRSHASLVSAGTERMLVEFGKASPGAPAVFSNAGMSLERSEIGDAKRVDLL